MRFYYVFSEIVTGFDVDASKNYDIVLFSDIDMAVEKLKKSFYKRLSKTKLREIDKKKIIEQFEQNIKEGKYQYHFRDSRMPEELQYFGKVHRRNVYGEQANIELYPLYRIQQAKNIRRRWKSVV